MQSAPGHAQMGAPVGPPPGASIMPSGAEGMLLDKSRLDDLAKQIDPNLMLEDAVKDALVDMTEEFVDDVRFLKSCI